jgi:hypothetical protein
MAGTSLNLLLNINYLIPPPLRVRVLAYLSELGRVDKAKGLLRIKQDYLE